MNHLKLLHTMCLKSKKDIIFPIKFCIIFETCLRVFFIYADYFQTISEFGIPSTIGILGRV